MVSTINSVWFSVESVSTKQKPVVAVGLQV